MKAFATRRPLEEVYLASAAELRFIYSHMWRDMGVLYSHAYDSLEARNIRELCEEQGIPMGYGRVTREPTQLHGYEGRRGYTRAPASGVTPRGLYRPDDSDD